MFEASWKLPWTKLELERFDEALAAALAWHPGVTSTTVADDETFATCTLRVPLGIARELHAPWIDAPLPERDLELQLDLVVWAPFALAPGGPFEPRMYRLAEDRDLEVGPDGFRDGGTDGGPVRAICRAGEDAYCAETDGQIWWYFQGDWRREVWTQDAPLALAHDGEALWGGGTGGALVRWADKQLTQARAPTTGAIRQLVARAPGDLFALSGGRIYRGGASAWRALEPSGMRALAARATPAPQVWATNGRVLVRIDDGDDALEVPFADLVGFGDDTLWVVESGRAACFRDGRWTTTKHDVGAPTAIAIADEHVVIVGREGEAAWFAGKRWETIDTRTQAELNVICSSPARGFLVGCDEGVLYFDRRGIIGELSTSSERADNARLWSLVAAVAPLVAARLGGYDPR